MVTPAPRRGTVTDLIAGLLDRGYTASVQPVLNAIGQTTNSGLIQQRLAELNAEAARLTEAGLKMQPDNPVLRALLADMETTMRVNARLADTAAAPVQQSAIQAAGTIQRQLALPGMTDTQLRAIGLVWNRPNPEAVARLVGYAQSDAWAAAMQKYGDDVLNIISNQAIRGISLGWNPLRTAQEVTRLTQSLPQYQANNLLRTLQLTSYRDATAAHQNANLDIAQQVVRIAALDTRTCLSCVAQHGDVIWDSETGGPVPRVEDHHSGRCTSVMIVKGRPHNIQSGEDWFNSLSPERQQQQNSFANSPGKFEAFQSGKATLRDFVHRYNDPTFGAMRREASLAAALRRVPITAPSGQIVTVDGIMPPDTGTPGTTLSSLETFLADSTGPLANAISDIDRQLIGFDANANFAINRDNVRSAAKQFVVESRDIQYGRDYIVELVKERARQNGVTLTDINGEQLYNQYMANRAQAIQTVAEIGNVRLTEAQRTRLNRAIGGDYLDMVYTTESSERGSLANQAQRNRGRTSGLTGAEKRQARENFRDWVLGLDG